MHPRYSRSGSMHKFFRLLHIYRIAARYRLGSLLTELPNTGLIRLLLKLPAGFHPDIAKLDDGTRLRLALEALGPIFIKFGQLLSTRRDMVPTAIADELAPCLVVLRVTGRT